MVLLTLIASEYDIPAVRKNQKVWFSIDEYQKIYLDDFGAIERIHEEALGIGGEVEEMELQSKFRCNG